jgi:DNA-binding MarR family transcriptional regulator
MTKEHNPANMMQDLMDSVRSLTRSSLQFQNAIALKTNLNVTDLECISYLIETGPSTAGDLATLTGLTTGAITNVIDRLEKAAYVRRENDPNDRRKVIVVFVPGNHKRIMKYYESVSADVSSLFSGYSRKELKFILSHTCALNEIYQKHTEEM